MEYKQKDVTEFRKKAKLPIGDYTWPGLPYDAEKSYKNRMSHNMEMDFAVRALHTCTATLKSLAQDSPRHFASVHCIIEEVEELITAFANKELENTIDGMIDLIYTVIGLACEMGVDLELFWEVIHKNNMEKINAGKLKSDGKFYKAIDHPKPDIGKWVIKQKKAYNQTKKEQT